MAVNCQQRVIYYVVFIFLHSPSPISAIWYELPIQIGWNIGTFCVLCYHSNENSLLSISNLATNDSYVRGIACLDHGLPYIKSPNIIHTNVCVSVVYRVMSKCNLVQEIFRQRNISFKKYFVHMCIFDWYIVVFQLRPILWKYCWIIY